MHVLEVYHMSNCVSNFYIVIFGNSFIKSNISVLAVAPTPLHCIE